MGLLADIRLPRVARPLQASAPTLLTLIVAIAFSGCQSLRVGTSGGQMEGDWLTEGGGPDRAQAAGESIRPPLELVWEFKTNGGFGPVAPLLLRDAVLVPTRKGEVHGIDLVTGKSLGVIGFGESIDGSPVVDTDGMMYVPISWGRRGLQAFDLTTGSTRWRDKRVPVHAGLLLAPERLIAADVESRVAAYDPRTGEVLWDRVLSDRAAVHGAPVWAGEEAIVVATDEGVLHALSLSDGSSLWQRSVRAPVYVTPAAFDGVVYVATTRGLLIAVDLKSGSERFAFDAGNGEVRLSPPAVTRDALVFGGSDGVLRAVDPASGTPLWTFAGGEPIAGAPLIAGDVVYFGDMGKILRALSLDDGHLLWEMELEGRIKSAMAAGSGRVVVLAEPRSVYLFRTSEAYAARD